MENCCMNCKHFRIWDGDPCCLHKDGWKIVLPTMVCENHDKETFKPVLELHESMWDDAKKEFFSGYTIKRELVEEYLKVYPDDAELIKIAEES